jgi:hypothetical protein
MVPIRTTLVTACAIGSCCGAQAKDVPLPQIAVRDVALGEFREGKSIQLDAYAKYSGELLLFDSKETADLGLVYPYCISANSPSATETEKREYDHKRVRVSGTLARYERAKPELNTIQTLAVIEGMVFGNWCYGPYVLKIDKIVAL